MFCKNCGTKLNDVVKFCNNCGMAQESLQPETQKVELTTQEAQSTVCKNCGAELKDGVKFCSECGTAIKSTQAVADTQQSASQSAVSRISNTEKTKKTVTSKGFIGGIAMAVFGFIAIYGGTVNGTFEKMSTYGADLSDIVTVLLAIGLIIGGILLAYKSAKKNNK